MWRKWGYVALIVLTRVIVTYVTTVLSNVSLDPAIQEKSQTMPDLRTFTQITTKILGETPIAEYLPTFLVDTEILALDGIPDNVDHCDAVQRHALKHGWHCRSFLFAVRSGDGEVTTGEYSPEAVTFMLVQQADDSFNVTSISKPEWWWLGLDHTGRP